MDEWGISFLLAGADAANLDKTRELLVSEGIYVNTVWNGLEAVERLEQSAEGTYQAILMELWMPFLDGYEVTRLIRSLGRKDAKEIPIIALTAEEKEEEKKRALLCGMNSYFKKPLTRTALYHILKWCGIG